MRPLYSHEAEQSVIGALMIDNGAIDRVGDLVDTDFWDPSHREIFRAIVRMLVERQRVDVVTLSTLLEREGKLEAVGGMLYLGELLTNVPTAANIASYAKIVSERRLERALENVAEQMQVLAHGHGPVNERVDEAQRLLFALGESVTDQDGVEIADAAGGFLELLDQRLQAGTHITGYASGLQDLDAKLCGFQAGDLIIVAGRPSMGKTTAAMQFAIHGARQGLVVQIFSMEMSRNQLVERAVSNIGRINSHSLRVGDIRGDDWDRVAHAVGEIKKMPLIIDDSPSLSVERMLARGRRLKRRKGRLDLVVVDYLQLMPGAGDSRNEQISAITRGLKLMARELGCPVIVLSQLSRKCEERTDRRPLMSDLRDSGAIEQDADVILMLYRDEVYHPESMDKGICEILVRKQRMGEIGDVFAVWMGEFNALGDSEWKRSAPAPKPRRSRETVFDGA